MDKESLIIGHFENNLTPKEKLFFDQLMKTDKSFADAVGFEEKTKIALTLEARDKLKSQLQNYEAKYKSTPRNRTWMYVAASIAILLGIWMLFMKNQPSNTQLYATYFEPYPNTVVPIVRGNAHDSEKQKAFAAYEASDYKKALVMFNVLSEITHEEYTFFYQAVTLMTVEQFEEAQDILTSTTWSKEYQEKADWYLALNYLHQDLLDDAKPILKNIVQTQSYNHKNANEVLRKLR